MKRLILILSMAVLLMSGASVFAQEKTVKDLTVYLGVISWEELHDASMNKPASHTEEFHRDMAKFMAAMHGRGGKGEYHVMVILKEKSTGKFIKDANIVVTAVAEAGPEEMSRKLQPMSMDGFSGFGSFYKLTFPGPYSFNVEVERNIRSYSVDFKRTIR